jgi:hypothetical protein
MRLIHLAALVLTGVVALSLSSVANAQIAFSDPLTAGN